MDEMIHVVEPGDTLSGIAQRYYGVMRLYEALFDANSHIGNADEIEVGQEIVIPAMEEPVHVVSSGETLGAIAEYWYGDSGRYMEIADRNGIDPDYIEAGQEIVIPLLGGACC